jgi:hypothetical protein
MVFYVVRTATVFIQWFGKHVSTTEAVFSAYSVPKVYKGQCTSFAGITAEKP